MFVKPTKNLTGGLFGKRKKRKGEKPMAESEAEAFRIAALMRKEELIVKLMNEAENILNLGEIDEDKEKQVRNLLNGALAYMYSLGIVFTDNDAINRENQYMARYLELNEDLDEAIKIYRHMKSPIHGGGKKRRKTRRQSRRQSRKRSRRQSRKQSRRKTSRARRKSRKLRKSRKKSINKHDLLQVASL